MIDILEESRVFSTRHLTYEEKQAVIECLEDSIRKGKVKITDRVENHEFMERFKLGEQDVLEYLRRYLKPEDIKDAQEKEQVRFYDLIKSDVYHFLMSNDYEYDREKSCFLKNKKK